MKYLLLLPLLFIPYTAHYDREPYLQAEYEQNGGCAFDDCPVAIQEEIVKEAHGSFPTSHYERYSKEWWRAYCNYATYPSECRY